MCGLAGILKYGGSADADLRDAVSAMSAALIHRGPDAAGIWTDGQSGAALGFRRLAILDLSDHGSQPMVSADERFVIVFNGEIYNHVELRKELAGKGHHFRGTSDTEVILAGIVEWGFDCAVERLWGMFAIAVWDREDRAMLLCRDRLGKKPLYYSCFDGSLLFASELKALRAHPNFCARLNVDAVSAFLRYSYVPSPACIYEGVKKLLPGTLAVIKAGGQPEIRRYWHPNLFLGDAHKHEHGSDREVVDETESLLQDAVQRRMIADVPLGALLSGGIDSSVVAALMQRVSDSPIRTFSIGFHENAYNEAHSARAVARHLGTEHEELYVSSAEAQSVIPVLSEIYDEPFADSSQIPTTLLSRMVRQRVTVGLSGDGGDELFGGYTRYSTATSGWAALERIPVWARQRLANGILAIPQSAWDQLYRGVEFGLTQSARVQLAGHKIHKLASALDAPNGEAFYQRLVSVWQRPLEVMTSNVTDHESALGKPPVTAEHFTELRDYMMAADLLTYLPDDVLTKLDRASMSASLEVRSPLLDHRLVEWVSQLPSKFKRRNGKSKWLLRQVLARHVRTHLTERPKMGFGVPMGDWLRGPLREWAEELLSPAELRSSGVLAPTVVRSAWEEHLRGYGDHDQRLWTILMYQSWRRRWGM